MKASNFGLGSAIAGLIAIRLDVVLPLVNTKGNPSAARLHVRVTQDSISAVADDAMEQAQTSAKFPQPLDSRIFDALSGQQSLETSFGAVLKLIKPLVKIGDEFAKVCSLICYDQN